MSKQYRAWDPLYGRVELSSDEFQLLLLPEVQRLRYIRMCNINSLLVTGASEISRFEHSVGVLRLAKEWIAHNKVNKSDAANLRAAAILHDIQTGPFGHSLQYVFEDNKVEGNFLHDDITHGMKNVYHQDVLAAASFCGMPFAAPRLLHHNWPQVAQIIQGKGMLGPLIAGSIDLDNVDNVFRLAYHAGVASTDDAQISLILARDIGVGPQGLVVPAIALERIERWQEVRKCLYKLLLLDWAEFSAKAMLTRALEYAIDSGLIGSDSWLKTDAELLDYLSKSSIGETQGVKELTRRLRRADLYEPLALLESPQVEYYECLTNVEAKRAFEAEICSYARSELKTAIKFIVHYILDNKKTERSVALTVRETGERLTVGNDSMRLLIGLFVSKSGLSRTVSESLLEKAKSLLANRGVLKVSPLEDPIDPTKKDQWKQQSLAL